MMDVVARAEEIAAELDAVAGLRATADPGKAATLLGGAGCVLVQPLPTFVDATLCGEFTLTWELVALVGHPGDANAAKRLTTMVQLVAGAFAISSARPAVYALIEGQQANPAYVMTLEE